MAQGVLRPMNQTSRKTSRKTPLFMAFHDVSGCLQGPVNKLNLQHATLAQSVEQLPRKEQAIFSLN
jgi:hypothetical protein